ncbi:MAG: flagellar basal-body rod protein FlgF [Thermodesulfovibrionales bacterium]|nr:flagellar basal-body rod protein FlgF [Thermodesulfovibrionales bacterium]
MHKGIYIALSGALMKQRELELLSENIANSDTPGYKSANISFRDYLISKEQDDSRIMTYLSNMSVQFTPGVFINTGKILDIAIEGKGFLSLEGGFYTRRGDLRKTDEGYLVTSTGRKVMGNNGPVRISEGEVEIKEDGSIYVDGNMIDKLKIVDFDDPSALKRAGEGLYETVNNTSGRASSSRILQGYIEGSNVEIVREMVKLISTMREFETFQKAIQTLDEAAGKINNEMARI